MKWIKNILWLVSGLILLSIALVHIGSSWMKYSNQDILKALPLAEIQMTLHGDVKVRTVYIDNSSDTTIVFIHGAPGSFDAFISYMKDTSLHNCNLLAYDRPGYGESSLYPMPSILDQSDILLNIINDHSTNIIFLIGHSYGGPIAGYTAAKNPNLISKTIMIAPLIDPYNEPIFWFSHFAKWKATKWLLPNDFQTAGTEKFEHSKTLKEIEPTWKLIHQPILHIHGGDDSLAPPTYNVNYSQSMIDSNYLDLRVFPNEGHLILWEKYELTRDIILDFVRK